MAITRVNELEWCDINYAIRECQIHVVVRYREAEMRFTVADWVEPEVLNRMIYAHRRDLVRAAAVAAALSL